MNRRLIVGANFDSSHGGKPPMMGWKTFPQTEPIAPKVDNETSVPATPAAVAHPAEPTRNRYLRSPENWVNLATLVFVAGYTGISYCTMQITKEAYTSVQRAFLTVSSFDASVRYGGSGFAKDTKYWWFVPNIKNSGNTPTQNLNYYIVATCPPEVNVGMAARMVIDCDYTRPPMAPDPEDSEKRDTNKNVGHPSTILGPQSSVSVGGIGITEASLQKLVEGFPLFESGVIRYNDIFPGSPAHLTKFCYQIGAYRSEKNEIIPTYALCQHWNCADEECEIDRRAYESELAADRQKQLKPK